MPSCRRYRIAERCLEVLCQLRHMRRAPDYCNPLVTFCNCMIDMGVKRCVAMFHDNARQHLAENQIVTRGLKRPEIIIIDVFVQSDELGT